MIKFNIASINQCTESEGPYKRLAIWFQGCNIKCNGCCNPHLQALEPAHIIEFSNLIDIISKARAMFGIEGVTYLGGEPTLQKGLDELSKKIRDMNLGVILFTGRRIDELETILIKETDLIIDGKFDINLLDNDRNMIGSKNQNTHFITNRYIGIKRWFLEKRIKTVEVNYSDTIDFNGDVIL